MKKLILATLMLAAMPAGAVSLYCPGTAVTTDREFGVEMTVGDGTVSCYDFGQGNIPGDDSDFGGWTFIEKDGINNTTGALSLTGLAAVGGNFTLAAANWAQFGELLLGFKSGEGQLDPDWAVFRLTPEVLAGTWSISGNQSLSHANLYGRGTPVIDPRCVNGTCPVPEPGSLALLGTGLIAIGLGARRRRKQF